MKKTALTIGLFSLVMVATSFTTSEIVSFNVAIDGGGQQGLDKRKQDVYATSNNQLNSSDNQLNSFSSDSQLTRSRIKVD